MQGVLDGFSPSCLPPMMAHKAKSDVHAALAEGLRVLRSINKSVFIMVGLGIPIGTEGLLVLSSWLGATFVQAQPLCQVLSEPHLYRHQPKSQQHSRIMRDWTGMQV